MNLLTVQQVAARIACHTSYVWKLTAKDPSFPKPIHLGDKEGPARARVTRWVDLDITNWLTHKHKGVPDELHDRGTGSEVHQDQGEEVGA